MELIESLLGQLTLEEKVSLVSGSDAWHTSAVPRLGIPRLKMSDGPNGVRGDVQKSHKTSVCFPAGVALAATWDPARIEQIAGALAEEAVAKGVHVVLAPTVNLHRTPLGGRNFECYSEDPWLTAAIATAYVRGLQSRGIGACLKHFACNESEYQRRTISSEVAERPLRELYLRPFELVIAAADPWCVMSAYNRVNGVYASSSRALLRSILKDEWGFAGVVVSDWGAAQEAVSDANAGLDLEMPGPGRRMGAALLAAVRAGDVLEKELDDKVRRLLRLLVRAGRFDVPDEVEERAEQRPEHRALVRRAAADGMVLLRNDGVLPLEPRLRRIAVIGPNAEPGQIMGGGSAFVLPHQHVSPLAALRERLPGVELLHEPGCSTPRLAPLFSAALCASDGQPGFDTEYWEGETFAGEPAVRGRATSSQILLRRPPKGIEGKQFAARYRGVFTAARAGLHEFGLFATGRGRLLLDGRERIDNWNAPVFEQDIFGSRTSTEQCAAVELAQGQSVELCVEYVRDPESAPFTVRFGVREPQPDDLLERAVAAAASAELAILIVGTNSEWETEGRDRESLRLPGRQDELIARVSAVQPRTVVVLNAGAPLAMPWAERVGAVLCAWFPGQEFGHALADVLLGDVNPAGRLPMTIPRRIEDTPAFTSYPGEQGAVVYAEGLFVGYRWYDARRLEPHFAFGHGLSYTRFRYGPLRAAELHRSGGVLQVSCEITNVGARPGAEVVQLYLRDVQSSVARPEQELRAFAKLELAPGETRSARFELDDRAFAHWSPADRGWRIEPGAFELRVGASSRDIRTTKTVAVLVG